MCVERGGERVHTREDEKTSQIEIECFDLVAAFFHFTLPVYSLPMQPCSHVCVCVHCENIAVTHRGKHT